MTCSIEEKDGPHAELNDAGPEHSASQLPCRGCTTLYGQGPGEWIFGFHLQGQVSPVEHAVDGYRVVAV